MCHLWSANSSTPVNIISAVCLIVWAAISYFVVNTFVVNAKKK